MADFILAIIWQLNKLWADVHLGTSLASIRSTLGKYGCLVCCITYIANAFERANKFTPVDTQNFLLAVNGFAPGDYPPSYNLVVWAAITLAYPKLKIISRQQTPGPLTKAQIDEIQKSLLAGVPVIAGVDYTLTGQRSPNHFVCLTSGYVDYVSVDTAVFHASIMCPYHGEECDITKYYGKTASEAILEYVIFDPAMLPAGDPLDPAVAARVTEAEAEQARLHGAAA